MSHLPYLPGEGEEIKWMAASKHPLATDKGFVDSMKAMMKLGNAKVRRPPCIKGSGWQGLSL